jgi:hypothetical protein
VWSTDRSLWKDTAVWLLKPMLDAVGDVVPHIPSSRHGIPATVRLQLGTLPRAAAKRTFVAGVADRAGRRGLGGDQTTRRRRHRQLSWPNGRWRRRRSASLHQPRNASALRGSQDSLTRTPRCLTPHC